MFKEIFSRKTGEIKHAIYEFIGKVTVTLLLSLAMLMTIYHAFEWMLSFLAKPIGIGAAINDIIDCKITMEKISE